MKLSRFEKSIDPTILQRGKNYYQTGAIENLEEFDTNHWSAEVLGSELYLVEVKLKDDKIQAHRCDCPYDWGPVCKHKVAMLYALREKLSGSGAGTKPKRGAKTTRDKIKQILDQLGEQEVKAYLEEKVMKDRTFRDNFMIRFAHFLGEKTSPEEYRKIVQSVIRNHSDHGFIDYHNVDGVINSLTELLQQADSILEHNPEESLMITKVVYECLPELVESMDDSDGETTILAEQASELFEAYLSHATKSACRHLFQWLKQAYLDNAYIDYGYDDVLDNLLFRFGETELVDRHEIVALLDKKIARSGEWGKPGYLEIKKQLLQSWGAETAAQKIIQENIQLPHFRKAVVEEKIAEKDYESAISLLEEGIKLAKEKHKRGTVKEWQEYLLRIAQDSNNSTDIVKWSKALFLAPHHDLKYYKILKANASDWPKLYEELLLKFHDNVSILAAIFNEEQHYEALLNLLQQLSSQSTGGYGFGFYNSPLNLLHQYTDILSDKYPQELLEMYQKAIYAYAQQTGRGIYHKIVEELKQMEQLEGGKARAKKIASNFKLQYKNRPAMQEILRQYY